MRVKKRVRNFKHRWRILRNNLKRGSLELRITSRDLSTKSLVFAGFSLTALIFVCGFYKDNLGQISPIIATFLIAFILFLISAERTRSIATAREYFIGAILYLVTTAFLIGMLIWFFWPTLKDFWRFLPIVTLSIYVWLLMTYVRNVVHSLTISLKRRRPQSGNEKRDMP